MTALAITEAEFQRQILELAAILGWRTMHVRKAMGTRNKRNWVTPTSVSGWPDAVLWSEKQQRLLFIEFKAEKGRVSDAQREVLRSLIAAGQEVHVLRPSDFDLARRLLATRPVNGSGT